MFHLSQMLVSLIYFPMKLEGIKLPLKCTLGKKFQIIIYLIPDLGALESKKKFSVISSYCGNII